MLTFIQKFRNRRLPIELELRSLSPLGSAQCIELATLPALSWTSFNSTTHNLRPFKIRKSAGAFIEKNPQNKQRLRTGSIWDSTHKEIRTCHRPTYNSLAFCPIFSFARLECSVHIPCTHFLYSLVYIHTCCPYAWMFNALFPTYVYIYREWMRICATPTRESMQSIRPLHHQISCVCVCQVAVLNAHRLLAH